MLVKNYKKFNIIQKILLGTGVLVSLFIFVIILFQKKNTDGNIVFIFDVSHSMNTKMSDNKNLSRLDLGKRLIKSIISKDNKQHQIGVIIFSKQASYYVAPTFDTGSLLSFTKSLQTNILPGGGSDLQKAINIFQSTKNDNDLVVVITDGDDVDIGSGFGLNQSVIAVGIGDDQKGKVLYPDGTTMLDEKGNIVYSKLDRDFVKKTSTPNLNPGSFGKAFFVASYKDVEDIDLGNILFVDNYIIFWIYIVLSLTILFGLKL